MRLKIQDIPEGITSASGSVPINLPEPDYCASAGDGIRCTVSIDRSDHKLSLYIVFEGEIRLQCSRCLSIYPMPVRGEMRLLGECSNSIARGCDENDEGNVYFEEDGFVNIGAAVYDEVITGIPLLPLCSPDCKGGEFGLGAACGAVAPSDSVRPIDPRWAPLLKLRRQ